MTSTTQVPRPHRPRPDQARPKIALITGASRGLGRALAGALAERSWSLVLDARDPSSLATAAAELTRTTRTTETTETTAQTKTQVSAIAGDVADPDHRQALATEVERLGGLDLLVNNASELGPSPLVPLVEHPLDAFARVYAVNTLAPLALLQLLVDPLRRSRGRVLNLSSDAAVEPYPGWGGYGASKAALDQLTAVLAVELPDLRIYAADPGDMATELHQQAYPGEDISDRPRPETVVPALLRLVEGDLPSGRYRAEDLASVSAVASTVAAGR